MSFAIETHSVGVRVVTMEGEETEALVFLRSVSPRRPQPETLGERLNAADGRFLPCEVDGQVELVHLDWVAYVECAETPPEVAEEEQAGALAELVVLELAGGRRLDGRLICSPRSGAQRLSDVLNAGRERFLMLRTGRAACYVNRGAVLRVRTL